MKKPNVFTVMIAIGTTFFLAMSWSIYTASDRQQARAEASGLAYAELDIREMNCSICKAEILDTLLNTDGISEVTPERKGAAIAYDGSKVRAMQMVGLVQGLGYTASVRRVVAR